jgi:hypothetical protein
MANTLIVFSSTGKGNENQVWRVQESVRIVRIINLLFNPNYT